ncbi:hypothetical protein BY996DRAFT_4580626 [Phakopsora pachyrhizi]|uniref:Template-activating factor I n=1 Tax=Phakopsora pachyrhizi TaxID=170000 RepID=A0AAV0AH79_PHAPC|nr:hypothetical protein BY996DRAFT_4580626 [Phakopsora pachyrhizi]CAH7667098.1 hypothetical protein PPACK8108_LOCUS1483 [Phakopsora pachyrhizi]
MAEEVKGTTAGEEGVSLKDRITLVDSHQDRQDTLKEAYGADSFEKVLGFDEQLLKAEWEAYNHKVKLLEPIYKSRSEFIKTIPGFWLKTMTNDGYFNRYIDPIDRDALCHLEDLTIEHDKEDARNVTFHFHFSKSNPYFSNRVLTKKFTVVKTTPEESSKTNGDESSLKTDPRIVEMNNKYDLDCPTESEKVKVDWTSKEHDLASKRPWLDDEALADGDEAEKNFDGEYGSFFNFFGVEVDHNRVSSSLLEVHSKALDLYAGLAVTDDDEFLSEIDEEDEDDEDDDDPNAVVDLESESADEPKKKKIKT